MTVSSISRDVDVRFSSSFSFSAHFYELNFLKNYVTSLKQATDPVRNYTTVFADPSFKTL
jgi:hypothetical protein